MNEPGMQELYPEHLVFAGNGMSSVACVEQLLAGDRLFDITIFGQETHANYDRTLLASVLAGERDAESITLNDIEWYQEHGIRTRLGIRVEEIDRANRAVRSSDGDWTSYDKLILATGATPGIPPIDGLDKPGVFVFGTLDDTRRLSEAARPGVRAVVIGGWLAEDAARGLRKRGCDVLVVGQDQIPRFTSARQFEADIVVLATDLRPNAMLAVNAGLEVKRGIVVDNQMETSDPYIFAIGGCSEHNGQTFDRLPPVLEQAKVLARHLTAGQRNNFPDLDSVFQELIASPFHHRAE